MRYKEVGDFKEYQEYVDGKEWKEIKDFYYKYCAPYRCVICDAHWKLVLHKRSYEFLTMSALKKRFFLKYFIILYLRKYMCYLCFVHNGMVHYDAKKKKKTELTYEALKKREEIVKRMHSRSQIGKLRPSDALRAIGKILNSM